MPASRTGMTVTKIRRSLGNGQLASSFNLLLPDAHGDRQSDASLPNAVVRELTVDKNTGLVNGAHFVDRRSGRELHAKAKAVVLGASCLESTRLLLNSEIANSSGVLGRYLHDQFYIGDTVVASFRKRATATAGAAWSAAAATSRASAISTRARSDDFLRGYAFDFYTGGTPDAEVLPGLGRGAQKEAGRLPRLSVLDHARSSSKMRRARPFGCWKLAGGSSSLRNIRPSSRPADGAESRGRSGPVRPTGLSRRSATGRSRPRRSRRDAGRERVLGVPSALVWSRPTGRSEAASRKTAADAQAPGRAMLRDPDRVRESSRRMACRPAERGPGERARFVGVRADVRARKEYPHRIRRPAHRLNVSHSGQTSCLEASLAPTSPASAPSPRPGRAASR